MPQLNHTFPKNLRLFPIAAALLIVTALCDVAHSWTNARGALTGTVKDASNNDPLPGTNVIVDGTTIGAATGIDGHFIIPAMPPGTYRVRASIIGYLPQMVSGIKVVAGDTARVNFKLSETAIDIPEVVVTAGKKAQSFMETPASISVVSARQIEQQNFVSIDDVLQFSPGVNLMGGQINIRGSSGFSRGAGSRVLLLVDGVPMLPGDSGDIKWDALPPNEIDHVEVVKGAASALYGSNALGGVVNVITKDPSNKPMTTLKSTFGIYDDPAYPEWVYTDRTLRYNHQDLSHSRTIGNLKLRSSIGRRESTGYAENGHYHRFSSFTKAKYNFSPTSSVTGYFNYAFDRHGEFLQWQSLNEATRVPPEDTDKNTESFKIQAGANYRTILGSKATLMLRQAFYRNGFENQIAETDPNRFFQLDSSRIVSRANKYDFDAQLDYELNEQHSTTIGGTASFTDLESDVFGFHDGRDFSGYAQHEWKPSILFTLLGSLRFDHHWVDTGLKEYHLNPRFGLSFHASPRTTLRISSGRGFRAATMAEQFTLTKAGGFIVIPNPNLSSEIGWSHEVGADFVLSHFFISTALFWSDYEDLIEGDFVTKQGQQVIQFQNFNRARIRGGEIELTGAFLNRHLDFTLNYTYLDARELERRNSVTGEIESVNNPLAYRAKHLLSGSLTMNWRNYFAGFDSRFVSRIEVVRVFPDQPRVSQKVTNVRVGARFDPIEVTLNAYNIFNYNYSQVESRLEPIRSFALTTGLVF